jgi:gliding motility-associated-like protein
MKHLALYIIIFLQGAAMQLLAGPVANNDTATVHQNSQVIIPVTANDINTTADSLTLIIRTTPLNGSVTVLQNSSIRYIPNTSFIGIDSFGYWLCDIFTHQCSSATVLVYVGGVDLPPVATDDTYMFSDTSGTEMLNPLANDTDPQAEPLTITFFAAQDSNSMVGHVGADSEGNVLFTHTEFACGTSVYNYTVCNYSRCDTATITITVNCPDHIGLPQGFSPNGDGINDVLVFTGLEYFAPASLKVFNRYGAPVFDSADYTNDWDGTDIKTRKPLPDGTYFYILQLSNKRSYRNFLVVNR